MDNSLKMRPGLEVCFSPLLFRDIMTPPPFTVVVVDILRASTSICTAFQQGVKEIIPVDRLEEARKLHEQGIMVAAERDGQILEFADIGNSAFEFIRTDVSGKTIAYSTTNGTQAIMQAANLGRVVIGAFSNLNVLAEWLTANQESVIILCAGWKGKFNLEDAFFAGALSELLLSSGHFECDCDAVTAARAIWEAGRHDPLKYMEHAQHRARLKRLGLDDVLPYSFQTDTAPVIPVMEKGRLINVLK